MLVATLVFNALYFRIAPHEVFGIISLFLTASLLSPALDLGTGRTAGRILAIEIALDESADRLRDAILTLQLTNALVALLVACLLVLVAGPIASGWLRPEHLGDDEVKHAIELIACAIALLVLRNFVIACLNGMKRQVLTNVFGSIFTVFRGIAGLAALLSESSALLLFVVTQLAVLCLECSIAAYLLWRLMPGSDRFPRINFTTLRESWRFSAGDGASVAIGTFMMHGDKLLLSAMLPLSTFGAYALISTVATGIGRFTSPFSAAFLPHFVELFARNRMPDLRQDYLVSTQLLSTIVLPLAAALVAFSPEIVAGLLGEDVAIDELPIAFAVLVLATIFNNLIHLPHGIQLAAGNSVTALRVTAMNAVVYLTLIFLLTPTLGVLGPAIGLFIVSAAAFYLMARVSNRLLGLGNWQWILHSILRPLVGAIVMVGAGWLAAPNEPELLLGGVWLVGVTFAAMACAILVSPGARRALRSLAGRDSASSAAGPSGT